MGYDQIIFLLSELSDNDYLWDILACVDYLAEVLNVNNIDHDPITFFRLVFRQE